MPTLNQVQQRDAERYRFLRALYDATDGDTFSTVDMFDFFKSLGLWEEEGLRLYRYLDQERLTSARTVGGIEITHAGVNEIEASLRSPNRATAHFSVPVIHHVEQHFHQPVGAVQTGAGSVAHVTQTIGHDFGQILEAVRVARESLATVALDRRREGAELLEGIEAETRGSKPSPTRIRARSLCRRVFQRRRCGYRCQYNRAGSHVVAEDVTEAALKAL